MVLSRLNFFMRMINKIAGLVGYKPFADGGAVVRYQPDLLDTPETIIPLNDKKLKEIGKYFEVIE